MSSNSGPVQQPPNNVIGYPVVSSNSTPSSTTYPSTAQYPQSPYVISGNPQGQSFPHNRQASSDVKDAVESVFKSVEEVGKTVTHKFSNVISHLTGGGSLADTAKGKFNKLINFANGPEKFWRVHFCPSINERLIDYFACHMSTTSGSIPGTLFVSRASFSFYSDNPVHVPNESQVFSEIHYKVVLPLDRVAQINKSINPNNRDEKCIQVVTMDSHQFWFINFISFSRAYQCMISCHANNTEPIVIM